MANGPTLIVMAAGLGSRFGGAKQFFELGPSGEVLADYSLFDAWRAGFSKAVFIVRRENEALVHERFAPRWKGRLAVETAVQSLEDLPGGPAPAQGRTKPWGTAHALWCARARIDGPFALINADDFYGRHAFEAMRRELARRPGEGTIIGYAMGETLSPIGAVARAVCNAGPDGLLRGLVECRRIRRVGSTISAEDRPDLALSEDSPVSMNFWGLPAGAPALFEPWIRPPASLDEELALPDVVSELIAAGKLRVRVLAEGRGWIGVTYREDACAAAERLRALAPDYPPL